MYNKFYIVNTSQSFICIIFEIIRIVVNHSREMTRIVVNHFLKILNFNIFYKFFILFFSLLTNAVITQYHP